MAAAWGRRRASDEYWRAKSAPNAEIGPPPSPAVVDWPLLLAGAVAIVPALLILLASYAPYEGHFRDNILFLFFMGGIFGGMVLALFEVLLSLPQSVPYRIGMIVLGFPLLEQGLKLVVLNRRKTQGDRAITFYGGAFGLGFATMAVLFKSQRDIPLLLYADLGRLLTDPGPALYLLVLGSAILLAHFATGIILGDGVRAKSLPRAFGVGVAALVPLQVFVGEFVAGAQRGRPTEGLVYLPLVLAYAGGLAWWAHTRLLPKALPPDAQRKRRRALRLRQRSGADGK